jgi:hypothetical protein
MSNCFLKVDGTNLDGTKSDTLVVSFASYDKMFGGINRFEFFKFLETNFQNISKQFYIDVLQCSYHHGIYGISKNIPESLAYLKNEIKGYKNVVFLGVSSGGYAAILFGSLLNVTSVIAFAPQTIKKLYVDEKFKDVNLYINNTTNYYIYGNSSISDVNSVHHISHCERIAHHPNVFLTRLEEFNMRKMRDNGDLYSFFQKAIN